MVVLNRRELGRQQMNSLLRGEKSRQRLRRGSPRDDSREERVANRHPERGDSTAQLGGYCRPMPG